MRVAHLHLFREPTAMSVLKIDANSLRAANFATGEEAVAGEGRGLDVLRTQPYLLFDAPVRPIAVPDKGVVICPEADVSGPVAWECEHADIHRDR